jgi:cob(I)alamin adenosyltransferase
MVLAVKHIRPGEAEMSTTRSDEENLRIAIAYLYDLDVEIEERSAVRCQNANWSAREDMLYQLDHARTLVAALEHHAPNLSCMSWHDGGEMLINLHNVRAWCQRVEARIVSVCSEGESAG